MRTVRLMITLFPLMIAASACQAQSLKGDWKGDVLPGLPIVVHVSGKPGAYKATADSPNQGAAGIPAKVSQSGAKVTIKIATPAPFALSGKLQGGTIRGTWSQNGHTGSMTLARVAHAAAAKRPAKRGPGLVGDWTGDVMQGLPIVVHISGSPGSYTATADSPAQGATGMGATVEANGNDVTITLKATGTFTFTGTVSGDTMSGTWSQNGHTGPMTFKR